jgi:hypothetical protein
MKSLIRTVAVGALLLSLAPAALAQDGVRFTIGVKAWTHTWSTWTNSGSVTGAVGQTETDTETVLVPSVNLRIRNFFISGDFFPEKEYDFLSDYTGIKRSEWSIVAGYYLVPQLAIAIGYKQINQQFSSAFDATLSVPMLGLQAGAPIGESGDWFIYGNGFFGPVEFKEKNSTLLDDQKGWYYSSELGMGYRFFERLAATVGYKTQTVRWEELQGKVPGYDYTAGWIFGLSFTF